MSPPMPPPRIGLKVRDLIVQLLTDEAGGFNATVAAWADYYPGVQPFALDFSASSPNFWLGDLDTDDIEAVQPVVTYPMMLTLATKRKRVANYEKFFLFSGDVAARLVARLAWPQAKAQHDFEGYGEFVTDVLVSLFNREQNQDVWNPYVAWGGDIDVNPSRIGAAEEHWVQEISFDLNFQVRVVQ